MSIHSSTCCACRRWLPDRLSELPLTREDGVWYRFKDEKTGAEYASLWETHEWTRGKTGWQQTKILKKGKEQKPDEQSAPDNASDEIQADDNVQPSSVNNDDDEDK